GSGPAGAVADVAGDGSWAATEALSGLARDRADAARCDDGHVGGVEVIAQALHRQRRAGGWPQRWVGRIDLALGIDVEGAILFDDPAVVVDLTGILRVPDHHIEARGRHEDDGRVSSIRQGSL